jgi:hypothetical protein
MRRILIIGTMIAVLLVVAAAASSARAGGSVDQRTRSIAYLLRKCSSGVTLALTVANGGSDVQVSEAVNLVKGACNSYRDRVLSVSSSGFGSTVDDAFGALDYWARGLGRVSNYVDNNKPSDLVTAKSYFGTARSFQHQAIVDINSARTKQGLAPLPFKNGI